MNLNEVFSSPEEGRVLDSIAAGSVNSIHVGALLEFEKLLPQAAKETLWSAIEWYSKECLSLKEGKWKIHLALYHYESTVIFQWVLGPRTLQVRVSPGGEWGVSQDGKPYQPPGWRGFSGSWAWLLEGQPQSWEKEVVPGPLASTPGEESDRSTVLILAGFLQGMSTRASPDDRDILLKCSRSLLAYAALLEGKPKDL